MAKQLVSQWLSDLDSHCIVDSRACLEDFCNSTGLHFIRPPWPEHDHAETLRMIKERGLGGSLEPDDGKPMAYGWEIAESLTRRLVPDVKTWRLAGRGSRFRRSIDTLRAAQQ